MKKSSASKNKIGRNVHCKHCKYGWITALKADPLICPSCRSWRWNTDASLVTQRELDRIKAFVKQREQRQQN